MPVYFGSPSFVTTPAFICTAYRTRLTTLIDQFLHIVFPLPALDEWAESLWSNPGWAASAREYHASRGAAALIVNTHPKVVGLLGKLLEPDVSFDRAYPCINGEIYLKRKAEWEGRR